MESLKILKIMNNPFSQNEVHEYFIKELNNKLENLNSEKID